MSKPKGMGHEVRTLKKELERNGEKLMPLTKLAPDDGTDASTRRRQLVWRNFVIKDGTKTNAMVVGPEHKEYLEGQEAAAKNTRLIFDEELGGDKRTVGSDLMRLASVHGHYFGSGGGFEKITGKRLTPFVKENYVFDPDTQIVKLGELAQARLRRVEKRALQEEGRVLSEIAEQQKMDVADPLAKKRKMKAEAEQLAKIGSEAEVDPAMMSNPLDPWGASAAIMRKRGGIMGVDDFA